MLALMQTESSFADHRPHLLPSLTDGLPFDSQELLRMMYLIRHFENEVQDLYSAGLVRGSTHLYQGQEAIAVGAMAALQPADTMTCTYRSHGATIAKGAPLDGCFGELLGRAGGICGGKGGSMHYTVASIGAIGSNAIVGAHLPIANGAALAAKYLNNGKVSLCLFGDGASNIGAFHEALNLAAIWKLPVIFIIENNQYGEYSSIAETTAGERLADRAVAYGMTGLRIDGNDVRLVFEAVSAAAARARSGEGPTLIEAYTYRHSGHSRADLATYRPAGELEQWLKRDPIRLLEAAMRGQMPDADGVILQIRAETAAEVAAAKERALSWPEPDISALYSDVIG